jgi:hypothetical protein
VARTTTTAELLRGDASFKVSKTAADGQGEGIHIELDPIDGRDLETRQTVSFDYKMLDANYADGDIKVYVYDVDNATLIGAIENDDDGDLLAHTGDGATFLGFFNATDSLNYRLLLHQTVTTATATDWVYDNVSLGPAGFAPATATNTIETNLLTADVTTDTTIADLTFSGLTVGKTYSVNGQFLLTNDNGSSDDTVIVSAVHNSVTLARVSLNIEEATDTSPDTQHCHMAFSFTAAAADLTFSTSSASAAAAVLGNNTRTETYVQLETRNDLSTNVVSNTQLTQSTVLVSGQGNGGTTLTAFVTDMDWTEVSDSLNAWSGSVFTAPKSGQYKASGFVALSAASALTAYSYVNGSQQRVVCNDSTASVHRLSWAGYLNKGDELSFRSANGLTLSNSSTLHWLEITSDPDFTTYGVTGEKNKVQTKILSADVTTNTTMSDLTFSNLTVGKWYEVNGQFLLTIDAGSPDDAVLVNVVHDGTTITTANLNIEETSDSSPDSISQKIIAKFQATATSLTFVSFSASANSYINGNGTLGETWAQIEERNDLIGTSEF